MASLRCLLWVHDCHRWRILMMRESPEAVKRSATIARNPQSRRGHGKARRQVRAGDGSEPRHRSRERSALRRGRGPGGVRLAHPAECERLVARAREIYGPVDVLVNNAALTYYVQVKDYPVNKWMRSWAVN